MKWWWWWWWWAVDIWNGMFLSRLKCEIYLEQGEESLQVRYLRNGMESGKLPSWLQTVSWVPKQLEVLRQVSASVEPTPEEQWGATLVRCLTNVRDARCARESWRLMQTAGTFIWSQVHRVQCRNLDRFCICCLYLLDFIFCSVLICFGDFREQKIDFIF
jgi:hypothetical protein